MQCENCLQILRTIQQSIALIELKSPSIEIPLIEEDVGTRFSSSERCVFEFKFFYGQKLLIYRDFVA